MAEGKLRLSSQLQYRASVFASKLITLIFLLYSLLMQDNKAIGNGTGKSYTRVYTGLTPPQRHPLSKSDGDRKRRKKTRGRPSILHLDNQGEEWTVVPSFTAGYMSTTQIMMKILMADAGFAIKDYADYTDFSFLICAICVIFDDLQNIRGVRGLPTGIEFVYRKSQ